jgi:hypothetical protein
VPRCCHLTRREFLQWSALVATTPILASLVDPERAYGVTRAQAGGPAVAINLELVTLTETSAILTWFTGDPTRPDEMGRFAPVPADTEVLLGTSPASMQPVLHDSAPTPYHYAELTGLEPGQTHFFVARSGGVPALPAVSGFGSPFGTSTLNVFPAGPFVFTTPQPPPGRFLFAIALCNDLHLGETVAGLATTQGGVQIPPGISQSPGLPPYAEIMSAALGLEARERGAHLLVAGGDVSAEAGAEDLADAKRYLDTFGRQGTDYLVARGNHDRPHDSDDSAGCSPSPLDTTRQDCFTDVFFPDGPPWFSHEAFGLRVIGLDTYDKIGNGGDNGVMGETQFAFVRDELARDRDQPTLVFGHHPVTLESAVTTVGVPLGSNLENTRARQLEALYGQTPGVFLHHSGHTHRNKRTSAPDAPGVVFQEVAAVKEYPGGFHLLRVFTGGYALNFYKFRSPLAQEWAERSRPEYAGLAPYYTFGNASDRNAVFARDLSGLQVAGAAASAGSGGAGAPPSGRLAASGGGSAAGVIGSAALAASIAAERWLRRSRASKA